MRSDVDFVITFEELAGMFDARGIELKGIQAEDKLEDATGAGRGYGVAGGVASAIEACIREYYPDVDVNIEHAESLAECRKMLMLAKAGKKKKRLSDRGYGVSGRLYCRRRNQYCNSPGNERSKCLQDSGGEENT